MKRPDEALWQPIEGGYLIWRFEAFCLIRGRRGLKKKHRLQIAGSMPEIMWIYLEKEVKRKGFLVELYEIRTIGPREDSFYSNLPGLPRIPKEVLDGLKLPVAELGSY